MVLLVYQSKIGFWLAQFFCFYWLAHNKFPRAWGQRPRMLPEKGVEILFLAYVLHI